MRGGALDLLGVGHVGGRDAGAHARSLDLAPRGLEPLGAARDEPDVRPAARRARAPSRARSPPTRR